MFPEMHLTVNEVEKMAVGEKIKFCQILALEQGGEKAGTWGGIDRLAPHTVSILLPGTLPRIRAGCEVKFMPGTLCSDPKTIHKSANLDKVLVRAEAAGIRG